MEESHNEYFKYVSKYNLLNGLNLEPQDIESISNMYADVLENRGVYEEQYIIEDNKTLNQVVKYYLRYVKNYESSEQNNLNLSLKRE